MLWMVMHYTLATWRQTMTQETKFICMGNQALSPENLNGADDARPFSGSACQLQSVETLDPGSGSEKEFQRPMGWIAEHCPFGERRRNRNSSSETGSMNCLH